MGERHALMMAWVRQILGCRGCSLEPASGDASSRRYWRARLDDGRSYVLMDAPPVAEDIERFAKQVSIPPGIVVGRLQKESHIKSSWQNGLRRRFTWKSGE